MAINEMFIEALKSTWWNLNIMTLKCQYSGSKAIN